MEEFRVGLIGCGHMAQHLIAQAASLEGVSIGGVADIVPERAKAFGEKYGAPDFQDYRKMLELPDINAVIVATPNVLHAEHAEAAAQAKKHVFSEKPMTTTLEGCDRMIRAAESNGVQLMVGHVLRYFPVFHRSHEIIASGSLGSPQALVVQRTGMVDDPFGVGWRSRMAESGGILMEVNAHELDFLRHLCGPAKTVYAEGRQIVPAGYDYPDTLLVQIEFQDGAMACLHASIGAAISEYHMTLQCSEGTLTNGGFGGPIQYARFGGKPQRIEASEIAMEDPYRHELRLFFEALRKGETPPVTGAEARGAVEMAVAAYRSIETGQAVSLPL